MKTELAAFPALAFVMLSQPLLAFAQQADPQQPPWNWPGPWHMWSGGWGFWWIFPLMMLFMIIVCVAFFLLAHKSGGAAPHSGPSWHVRDRPSGDPTFSALQILNERFARSEIQKAEYEEKKTAILSGGQR